ncbi:PQQ-dependent sugar dehydrogenase [Enterovirga aerilata]|uniref:PQQ-dependent sugar dehydrogenase n=1 Tax=Enterovirga aerilata TaxID=2730920 RepID=A0A849HW39_9HYPH|nr:PQQ-dependent sugar dehydrogenase [Enterovirga sp. DB1703]NNM71756.1 PQQ-dependent sugar dehydrogenase [Enterovirga sp. DB1703]
MRITIAALAASLATFSGAPIAAQTAETREPNAPNQRPAFAGQTRAPLPDGPIAVATATVAEGIQGGWAFEFMPDGRMIVTEKAGRLRIVGRNGRPGGPVAGVPAVDSRGQGGLLDVALSPRFAEDRLVYLSFTEPRQGGGNGTSVARGRLVEEGAQPRLEKLEVIFRQVPAWDNNMHFGSRLVFAPDGKLFVTVGERSDREPRVQAQSLSSGLGKVFRINPDGSVPPDNPFVGREGAQGAIWSFGHRNVQAATLDGAGRLWIVEHGPRGGDELNRPEAGKNYGWPEVTYGLEYSGQSVGGGVTQRDGTEQPVYYWDPVIAPSGMASYEGDLFLGWRGALLVGGLVSQGIVVLRMAGDRVASEERIPLGARIRDVRVGPDGAVYAMTETRGGGASRILRLSPK